MTNEEMAQVLESEARLHEGKASLYEKQLSGCDRLGSDREAAIRGMAKRQRDRAACLKAGAAALRAGDNIRQWNNKVRTASYRDLAIERIWHEAASKVIDLLPEPPEGV